jgi:serine/threonine protein kinase
VRLLSNHPRLRAEPCKRPALQATSGYVIRARLTLSGSDSWQAAGVTLYLLTTGQYPFAGGSLAALFENIAHIDVRPPLGVSPELHGLLRGILTAPETRLSIADIKRHPYALLPLSVHHANNHRPADGCNCLPTALGF